jgi:glycosyltransferase involved in cell wall biosynthesis
MNKPMKILTIVYDLGMGGTQRAAQNFAVAYADFHYDSRVLPLYKLGPRSQELESQNIKVYAPLVEKSEMIEEINLWGPQIIHIHRSGEEDDFINVLLGQLKKGHTRIIETNVFSLPDNSKSGSVIDLHFHLSLWCLWKWNLFLKKKSLGIVLPYLVIPDNFYKEERENIDHFKKIYKIPLNKYIFGRIGQNSPAKFHADILMSFEKLNQKRSDIHLVIVGLPEAFEETVKNLQCFRDGAITLIKELKGDELLRLAYNSFDVFLHYSSIGESFGMVLAEAQLCETPIITISTPKVDNSQLEVCPHSLSSIILKNPKDLVSCMDNFASQKMNEVILGSRGREHILANYTPEIIIPKLDKLFGVLLSSRDINSDILNLNLFKTNLVNISIYQLSKIGLGIFPLSTQMFLIFPKFYLYMAVNFYSFKNFLKRFKL